MYTDCTSLLANLYLNSYEADFIKGLLRKKELKLTQSFNYSFHYIDDVLLLNNSTFIDYVQNPNELEIKDTTEAHLLLRFEDDWIQNFRKNVMIVSCVVR